MWRCGTRAAAFGKGPGDPGTRVWPWPLRCGHHLEQPGECLRSPGKHPKAEGTFGEGPANQRKRVWFLDFDFGFWTAKIVWMVFGMLLDFVFCHLLFGLETVTAKYPGPDHHVVATTLVNLGSVYGRQEQAAHHDEGSQEPGPPEHWICKTMPNTSKYQTYPNLKNQQTWNQLQEFVALCILHSMQLAVGCWWHICSGWASTRRNGISWSAPLRSWKQSLEPTVTRCGGPTGQIKTCANLGDVNWNWMRLKLFMIITIW